MTAAADAASTKDRKVSLITLVEDIASDAQEDGVTLKALTENLGDRAFGAALFVLALPCCIPFLYIVPQIVALPMAALAFQMMIGRKKPWLPSKFAERRISKDGLEKTARGGRKFFGWAEAVAKPRLTFLNGPKADRLIGAILCIFCLSILTPLPSTNTVPGFAVALVSFGMMERDGLMSTGGLILGSAWVGGLIFVGIQAIALGLNLAGV